MFFYPVYIWQRIFGTGEQICRAMHFWRWGEYGGICVGVRVDAKVRSQTQAPFGEAYQGSWWPFNHYKPRIRLCFLPETEDALRSHQECCLSASQCCHIDFHLYQNYGSCIVFPILLVTWPHCDVAIPFAFTPGNPIWEDFSFLKSHTPTQSPQSGPKMARPHQKENICDQRRFADIQQTFSRKSFVFFRRVLDRGLPIPISPRPLAPGCPRGVGRYPRIE